MNHPASESTDTYRPTIQGPATWQVLDGKFGQEEEPNNPLPIPCIDTTRNMTKLICADRAGGALAGPLAACNWERT